MKYGVAACLLVIGGTVGSYILTTSRPGSGAPSSPVATTPSPDSSQSPANKTPSTQLPEGLDLDQAGTYEKAFAGDSKAMFDLGMAYYSGKGAKQDYEEAEYWFRESAERGNADAMTQLGTMYSQGQGVNEDRDEAIRWYTQAARLGNRHAQRELQKLQPDNQ